MIRQFIGAWILYWVMIAVVPVHSMYPATLEAFLLQLTFVTLVIIPFLIVNVFLSRLGESVSGGLEIANAYPISRIAIVLSVVGFAALAYDKVMVQGIDYTAGIATAREEWRQLGEEREGAVSSVFSIIGYLFGSAYYVAVVLAITQYRSFSTKQRISVLTICFALVMANSVITGGRSNVLLLGVFALTAISVRNDLRIGGLLKTALQRIIAVGLVMAAIAYTVYVFFERAATGGNVALDYAFDFLPFLGLEVSQDFRKSLGEDFLSSLLAMFVLVVSYLTHSFAVVAAIIDGPSENKTIVFVHVMGILHKIGLGGPPDGDWFLAGRFPSLPGALYHQFGLVGCVLITAALGGCAAIAKAWNARQPHRLLPLGLYTMLGSILILSPVLFAGDFLSFPFVFGSFFLLAVWGRLSIFKSRRRSEIQRRYRIAT